MVAVLDVLFNLLIHSCPSKMLLNCFQEASDARVLENFVVPADNAVLQRWWDANSVFWSNHFHIMKNLGSKVRFLGSLEKLL